MCPTRQLERLSHLDLFFQYSHVSNGASSRYIDHLQA
uniref:Uncharacterized protein n=1 Tax=Arundo donax TaxID=35708 RepID=A0A0A9A1I8_ARUDO